MQLARIMKGLCSRVLKNASAFFFTTDSTYVGIIIESWNKRNKRKIFFDLIAKLIVHNNITLCAVKCQKGQV